MSATQACSLALEPGKPRTLAYCDDVRKDLTLLELDEGLLEELMRDGCGVGEHRPGWVHRRLAALEAAMPPALTALPSRRRLSIKGAPDEDAVLCSSRATYALKHVETSNLILLVPEEAAQLRSPLAQRTGSQGSQGASPAARTPPGLVGLGTQIRKVRCREGRAG